MAGAKSYEDEAQALDEFRKCMFGITKMAAIRCAIELGIPDVVENHPGGVTLAELSSQLGCSSSILHRIMRFLTHQRIFKEIKMDDQDSPIAYAQTAFSHLLMKNNMAPLFLFTSTPALMASKFSLSKFLVSKNSDGGAFQVAHGVDLWQYIEANPSYGEVFHKGMACHARSTIAVVLANCMKVFEGIGCLVDVAGGNGTTLRAVVQACPWISRAINFDLPHVLSSAYNDGHVEHVGGDMFVSIPSADAAFLMRVLHDWNDEACVKILKNCKEAIPKKNGKVIIVDIVIDAAADEGNDRQTDFRLASDISMMMYTVSGKKRTSKEWINLLSSAGFSKYIIEHIPTLQSVIVAYP